MLKDLGVRHLRIHSDSQLIVGQVQGEYEAWELNMIKYLQNVKDFAFNFTTISIQQILRAENVQADLFSKLAMVGAADLKRNSYLTTLEKPNIEEPTVMKTDPKLSWIDPILHYLQDGVLRVDRDEAKKLRHLAPQYLIYDGRLYKKSFTLPLL
ncbi:uncharacterized protein [Elaeis guineensis]|uniref:uncharacterized protein n=1 Tax=Elaeis guineensis var. tenera TaxID=51953 RepID=UPI003C6D4C28